MPNLNASDACLIPEKRSRTASGSSRPDQQTNQLSRKRTRGHPSSPRQDESFVCPSPGPFIVERRRVNPDNLAKRLGPDLVRDMERHIYPGNKDMPTFAVRKELQERYNIDRRHIYDYFHSRGLRVVKEDRHGNLLRAREKNRRALSTDVTILRGQGTPPLMHVRPSSPINIFQDILRFRSRTRRVYPTFLQMNQRASATLRNSHPDISEIKPIFVNLNRKRPFYRTQRAHLPFVLLSYFQILVIALPTSTAAMKTKTFLILMTYMAIFRQWQSL
jgi:hypothetical protein